MSGAHRNPSPSVDQQNAAVKDEEVIAVDDDGTSLESEIKTLRGRWELASVLNFLTVFEEVIGNGLKMTAEDIEAALVRPNTFLTQLHFHLLKGIPPVSKTLNVNDAWVTALCKKITPWWPWVAEGEIPLKAANGEEIARYKELSPTNRLQILKALCEVRAEQDDIVSHINDAVKKGTEISSFRKCKCGGDGNATYYWFDGGPIMGYRLYKEVKKAAQMKMKGKSTDCISAVSFEWRTLATNLEEFRKALNELSSSKVTGDSAAGKNVETRYLPLVEKFYKKKQREFQRKQRQERLLNDFRSWAGSTRACRTRGHINYTFDDYDRAIDEAIEVTKKSKKTTEQRNEKKEAKLEKLSPGDLEMGRDSKDEDEPDSVGETERDGSQQDAGDDDLDDNDYNDYDNRSESGSSVEEKANPGDKKCFKRPFGSRWSMRLAANLNYPAAEATNLATKNKLRQRPTRNSAFDEAIVFDSEDENTSQNTIGSESGHEELSS